MLLRFVREVRSQDKPLLPKLERQMGRYRVTTTETEALEGTNARAGKFEL